MKTKSKKEASPTNVQIIRAIKEEISRDICGMTFEQLQVYLAERQPLFSDKLTEDENGLRI